MSCIMGDTILHQSADTDFGGVVASYKSRLRFFDLITNEPHENRYYFRGIVMLK